MELIDSHAHIQGKEYAGEVTEVVERARQNGIAKVIVVGGAGDLSSNEAALKLAESQQGLYATVGMHPHDAKDVNEADFERLKELTTNPKVIAVGETGLDFYYDHSPQDIQRRVFSRFIAMARETGLPLIIHDRDAHREIADLLRQQGEGRVTGVIHCFTGDYDAAKTFMDLGFYLSFSGIITFKNAGPLQETVRQLPVDRMLVETDSPYLAPVPYRGRRNEPAYVRLVAETIARIKNLPLEEAARITSRNTENLFGI